MATRRPPPKEVDKRLRPKFDDTEALLKAVVRERTVKSRSDVLREGEVPTIAHLLIDGHTYRYRMLKGGRRQITAVLMPGDICDLEAVMRGKADYSVGTLTDCVLGEIPTERFADLTTLGPDVNRALWRRLLRDEAISREWLVNIGCRDALERVAHVICELRVRLEAINLGGNLKFQMPFTQVELADALGLSPVHVNRVLQQLRKRGLIRLSSNILTLLDVTALETVADFDPTYLRLAGGDDGLRSS